MSYLYFRSLPVCTQLAFILSLKCILTEPETTLKFPQLYIHTLTVMDAMKSVGKYWGVISHVNIKQHLGKHNINNTLSVILKE